MRRCSPTSATGSNGSITDCRAAPQALRRPAPHLSIQRVFLAPQEAQAGFPAAFIPAEDAELAAVGVLADLDTRAAGNRQVAQGRVAVIDQFMRLFRVAAGQVGETGDRAEVIFHSAISDSVR
jgi:hypothetical protein